MTGDAAQETGTTRPLPDIDSDNREFWESCRRHELRLQKCRACGTFRYYPAPVCPNCSSFDYDWECVSGKGTVYSFSVVHRAPNEAFAADVPYVYAIVELEEGPMMTSNVVDVDTEQMACGMAVEVTYDDLTQEITLPKFKPVRRT